MRPAARALLVVALALAVSPRPALAQRGASRAPAEQSGALVLPPRLVRFVEAPYPPAAKAAGLEGTVGLVLTIGVDGRVDHVRVFESAGHGFDRAAVAAARRFVFDPARRDFSPIPSRIRYRYVFELERGAGPTEVARTGALSGVIRTRQDQPVPGAEVELRVKGREAPLRTAMTDAKGRFAFEKLPAGTYEVAVFGDTYGRTRAEERVEAGQATEVVYRLRSSAREKEPAFGATAVIEPPPREVTRRTLKADVLTRIPGTRGDALRAVEILPGVARPPFGTGTLIVRGAAPNDSQTLLDGVPVPLLYHFGGLTSFFQSQLLQQIDFYPGNFSARYGRRTGGILDVTVRDPRTDRLHGMVELGVIDASALLEGPITGKFAVAGAFRRSLIDLIFPKVVPDDVGVTAAPVYYDYQLVATWRPTPRDKVRLVSYGSTDHFALVFKTSVGDDPAIRGDAGLTTRFFFNHLEWHRDISPTVQRDIQLSIGPTHLDFGLGEQISFKGDFLQTYLRTEWRARLSDTVRLIAGLDLNAVPFHLRYVGPPPGQGEGESNRQRPLSGQRQVALDERSVIVQPGLYVESDLQPLTWLQALIGLRLDYYSDIERWTFDPRLALRFAVTDALTLKAGVGLFSQPPQPQESSKDIGNPHLDPIRSVHVSAGADYDVARGVRVGLEGFYKRLWDRVLSTTPEVGDVFVGDAAALAQTPYVTGGVGRIYGAELSARIDPEGRPYFGYLSYTLSRSERRDGPPGTPWRLFDFDQTHIFTLAFTYELPRNWQLGGTLRLVSGNPETPIVGSIYDALNDIYQPVFGRPNSERAPFFNRLDVRVQKRWDFAHWKLTLFLDVQNIYNRQNPEGRIYNFDYTESTPIRGLPIIPALGLRGEL
ncbi:MAG: TonB-dependent receptor [Myxococcales bacterium]|nr:TonB-dependent receptor [Myxococcales bacterium]